VEAEGVSGSKDGAFLQHYFSVGPVARPLPQSGTDDPTHEYDWRRYWRAKL